MQKRKGNERMFEFPQRNRPSDKPSQAWNHLVVQNFKTCHFLNPQHQRNVTNIYLFQCRFCVVNVVRFQAFVFWIPFSFFSAFCWDVPFPLVCNHETFPCRLKKMQWLRPRLRLPSNKNCVLSAQCAVCAVKTSQELRMLSRSLSDSKSLLLNVMIQVSQFVSHSQLCH